MCREKSKLCIKHYKILRVFTDKSFSKTEVYHLGSHRHLAQELQLHRGGGCIAYECGEFGGKQQTSEVLR